MTVLASDESPVLRARAPEDQPPAKIPSSLDAPGDATDARTRVARAASDDFQFVWRLIRRLGVRPDAAVDDAVQRVFEIAARKAESIAAGSERAFLFKTAVLAAAEERRRAERARTREAPAALELSSADPDPETALEARRNRERLDAVLDELPEKLRTVFVLYELEGLLGVEIAALLSVPEGTVASRLRKARELFRRAAQRMRAKLERRNPR